mmetsp:Transcript_80012/g.235344  ORF Transcript_80012/g.235344 Transcript_80012/m.235344 type:complete len:223 (+) Transcript_80012:1465-2133(+)
MRRQVRGAPLGHESVNGASPTWPKRLRHVARPWSPPVRAPFDVRQHVSRLCPQEPPPLVGIAVVLHPHARSCACQARAERSQKAHDHLALLDSSPRDQKEVGDGPAHHHLLHEVPQVSALLVIRQVRLHDLHCEKPPRRPLEHPKKARDKAPERDVVPWPPWLRKLPLPRVPHPSARQPGNRCPGRFRLPGSTRRPASFRRGVARNVRNLTSFNKGATRSIW